MKKKVSIITSVAVLVIGVIMATTACKKQMNDTAFNGDGKNWSATVEDGDELTLQLDNDNESEKWSVGDAPECMKNDSHNKTKNGVEYHITALTDGEGEMEFSHTLEDGTVEKYKLTLSISRHKMKQLQIDTVTFEECK